MPRQPWGERVRDSLRLRALDVSDRLRGRADRLVPPRRLNFVDHFDYVATGDELLTHLVGLGGLQTGHAVLEAGCGLGRTARPLAGHLSREGSYDGFDVHREAIGWCRRRYGRMPNFRFQVADVYSRRHNPVGAHAAAEYRFPYEDERFDFVILNSVLTHLLEAEADHHIAEAARVLRPGGRAFTTWFLLDDDSRAAIADGRAGLDFLDPGQHVAVVSEDAPEEAVAYDVGWVRERLAAHGLTVDGVHPGTWTGREEGLGLQDIVVATR